ncbi:hypothetical protein [Streptomyces sp. NPDC048603]|uniref:hypothetical protein n=1 Tax=Streptomyces sp. NPDC048603 TaxID=3365577 RepID=UPI003713F4EC
MREVRLAGGFRPGRSVWTTLTGWCMVLSATAAVGAALWGVSPHPPLRTELGLAGLTVVFAALWVAASYRARLRPLDKRPAGDSGAADPFLRWLLATVIVLGTFAALLQFAMVSAEYGRETERLKSVGYGPREVPVVRSAGDPAHHPASGDSDEYWVTDLVLRIPFDSGPREVTVPAVYTRDAPPAPGTRVSVYYAPADPGTEVTDDGQRMEPGPVMTGSIALFASPLIIFGYCGVLAVMEAEDVHALRRFRPRVHLPALGLLLTGLLLLLPKAQGFQVGGFDDLPLLAACLTPALAAVWISRNS